MNILIGALGATFSAAEAERKAAEQTLAQMQSAEGYVQALLSVVMGTAALEVRQAAAIQLKNTVVSRWGVRRKSNASTTVTSPAGATPPALPLSDADKAAVRGNLVEAVCSVPRLLQKQLCVALQSAAFHDYPAAWPDLVSRIGALLGAADAAVAYGALQALRAVYRNLDYVRQRDPLRVALDGAAPAVFGALARLAAAAGAVAPTAATLAFERGVLRVFVSAVRAFLPPHFCAPGVLAQWLGLVGALLARPLRAARPAAVPPSAWWRAPVRAAEFLLAWLHRYGRPAAVRGAALRRATAPFRRTAAPAAAQALVECVARRAQLGTPERLVAAALGFVGASSRFPTVYAALAPRMPDIIAHVVFPLVCATPAEEALAENDPAEYLRAEFGASGFGCGFGDEDDDGGSGDGNGESTTNSNLRLSATNALVNLCQRKPKETLMPLMQFVARTLATATQAGDARAKFGALVVVTALDNTLKRSAAFRAQLEPMLRQYVVPELASAHTLLRAMACLTLARYADVAWTAPPAPDAAFAAALERVLALTHDPQLVVAAFAALSLKHLVQVPAGKELLRPRLAEVFATFFRFIDLPDVDSDDMVMTLEVFAEVYADEIAPYAADVCVRLCRSFLDTLRGLADSASGTGAASGTFADDGSSASAASDENGMKMFKAVSCLETLNTVVGAVHTAPALVAHLAETVFVPFFGVVLALSTDLTSDYMDDLVALLQLVTCYAEPLPPALWGLYAPLLRVVDTYPSAVALLVGPVENLVAKAPDAFLADPARLAALAAAAARVLRDPAWDEQEALKACQLAEVPLLHLPGRVDSYASALIDLVLQRLFPNGPSATGNGNGNGNGQEQNDGEEDDENATPTCLQVLLLELVLDVLAYNPQLGLARLEAHNAVEAVLGALARLAPAFARPYDKQVAVLGLAAVLRVPHGAMPAALRARLGAVVVRLLRFLRDLKQQQFVTAQAEALDALHDAAAAKGVKAQTLLPDALRHDPFSDDLWDDSDAEDDDDDDDACDSDDALDAYADAGGNDDAEGDDDEDEADDGGDDEGEGGDMDGVGGDGDILEDEFDDLCDLDDEDVQNPVTEAPHRAVALDAIAGLVAGPLACPETVAVCNALPEHYKQQIRLWQQDPRFNSL